NLALDYPRIVNRLVISGSWVRIDRRLRTLLRLRKIIRAKVGADAYKILSDLFTYPPDIYESATTSLNKGVVAPRNRVPKDVLESRINMLLEFDRGDELCKLHMNTLVIGASDDQMVPMYHSYEL